MNVDHVEVLAEEPSMEAALRLLLPAMLGGITFEVYAHQCKEELLQQLPNRLRGYARWIPSTWRIVIVLDRDDDDCRRLKHQLETIAQNAGLITRPAAVRGSYTVVNRLAIEELEAWYFGDWQAVLTAYPKVSETIPAKVPYRNPDAIAGGTWEAFERVLRRGGYFKTGLRKIEAARAIARQMVPDRNRSRSFQVLREALREMATT